MRRGDVVAAVLWTLALLAPFTWVVILGDGRPHHHLTVSTTETLVYLLFVALAGMAFYAYTLVEGGHSDED